MNYTTASSLRDLHSDEDEITLEGQAKDYFASVFASMVHPGGKPHSGAVNFAKRVNNAKAIVGKKGKPLHHELLGREWRFING